jgi:D-galactarolactone isomerase
MTLPKWPAPGSDDTRLTAPVIIDHMGHATTVDQPQYRTVRKLLDTGKGWIKVSGLNMGSKAGAPGYSDTVAVAQSYIHANPERVLWGSNWPMPGETTGDITMARNVYAFCHHRYFDKST